MEKVSIKALPNPDNPQLSAKYVGAKEYIIAGAGEDGKTLTGLDENALDILRIEDSTERKKVQAAVKKEREELQRLLGRDLDVNSDFWDDFFIVLDDELTLDTSNPMHRLIEKVLVANKKVAPSIEAISNDERYINCIFYIHREAEENSKAAKKALNKDKAVSKLFIISEENPRKLVNLYSYLFGYSPNGDIDPNTAYLKIKELIEVKDEKEAAKNIKKINDALEMKPEEISTKLILDKAVKKRIVTSKGNIYRRGDLILGNDYEEALAYLMSAEASGELISLKKEVDKS